MLQRKVQKEITDQYEHYHVYQLEKQAACTDADQNIDSFNRRGIKSFQHQLFPQAEKSKRDTKQRRKKYGEAQLARQDKIYLPVFLSFHNFGLHNKLLLHFGDIACLNFQRQVFQRLSKKV